MAQEETEILTENIIQTSEETSRRRKPLRLKTRVRAFRRRFRNFRWKISWESFGLKLLDIFILKKYLGTFFFATILILAVVAMFDITEKLDAFLTAPLKETIFD